METSHPPPTKGCNLLVVVAIVSWHFLEPSGQYSEETKQRDSSSRLFTKSVAETRGMNANRKLASHLFASALRAALVDAHGRLPSAAKFADAFNLRAHGTSTITRETARKWLRGDAMPEIGKMRVLIHWLNLDPSAFLQPVVQPMTIDADELGDSDTGLLAHGAHGADVRQVLTDILPHLDDRSVEALYLTAAAMQALKKREDEATPAIPASLRFVRNQEA